MRSPRSFIIKPSNGRRYDNIKDIGGMDFIVSSSKEDHMVSNRFAEVVETPIEYDGPIKRGDVLVVHHNVFKFYNDMRGRERSSHNFVRDDTFLISDEQFFLFYDGEQWKTTGKYCFIKPSPVKDYYITKPGSEEPLVGKIKYITDELLSHGLSEGDEIAFTPESEYEFNIEGEKLYRVNSNNICILLE
jgi:hypothetical protein|tara:strand:+ start:2397 stop:2963 length:567 start_codon:yes stop_codon:yes gene_type:complete